MSKSSKKEVDVGKLSIKVINLLRVLFGYQAIIRIIIAKYNAKKNYVILEYEINYGRIKLYLYPTGEIFKVMIEDQVVFKADSNKKRKKK